MHVMTASHRRTWALASLRSSRWSGRRPRRVARAGPLDVQARNIILFSRREAAAAGIELAATDSRSVHIGAHLKAQQGELVRVGVVNGLKGTAVVKSAATHGTPAPRIAGSPGGGATAAADTSGGGGGGGGVRLAWNTWQEAAPPPPVTLLLAMPRPRALRRLWRRLAEIGVRRVVLVTRAELVPSGYGTSESLRPHVVLSQVLQGAEQAGETVLPMVQLASTLRAGIAAAVSGVGEREGAEGEDPRQLRTLLPGPATSSGAAATAPEGGAGATTPAATSPPAATAGPAVASRDAPGRRAESPGSDEDGSERLAFITQCLQERQKMEDERWELQQRAKGQRPPLAGAAPPRAAPGPTAAAAPPPPPPPPLRVLCSVKGPALLSDVVVAYKRALGGAGLEAWRWNADRPERAASPTSAAGDYYYGAAGATQGAAAAAAEARSAGAGVGASLTDIMTEAYNAGGGNMAAAAPRGADAEETASEEEDPGVGVRTFEGGGASARGVGAVGAVGTTPLDTSQWGAADVTIAVGPERGWTEAEEELLAAAGFSPACIGARTLSTPTAALAAVAIAAEALR